MPRRGDTGTAQASSVAPVAAVRELVRDVTRHADLSPEVTRVRWCGTPPPTTRSRVGARFTGWSRTGPVHWVRTCEVVADERRTFAWVTLPTWWNHDATLWRVDLTTDGTGCLVTLSYEVLADAPWFIRVGGVVSGRVRRLPFHLQETVDTLARAAASRVPGPSPRG